MSKFLNIYLKILSNFIDLFEKFVIFYMKNVKKSVQQTLECSKKTWKIERPQRDFVLSFWENLIRACYYHKFAGCEVRKYPQTVTSESREHSRTAASYVCEQIDTVHGNKNSAGSTKQVIVWSDGMGTQFHSKFLFILLSKFNWTKSLKWHYNEARCGKGPMDGVGGTLKNLVFRAVKSEKFQ